MYTFFSYLKQKIQIILFHLFNFFPDEDMDSLKSLVHGVILGVPMPFNLANPDCCNNSGLTCPLKAGETYKYVNQLSILSSYPRVSDINIIVKYFKIYRKKLKLLSLKGQFAILCRFLYFDELNNAFYNKQNYY